MNVILQHFVTAALEGVRGFDLFFEDILDGHPGDGQRPVVAGDEMLGRVGVGDFVPARDGLLFAKLGILRPWLPARPAMIECRSPDFRPDVLPARAAAPVALLISQVGLVIGHRLVFVAEGAGDLPFFHAAGLKGLVGLVSFDGAGGKIDDLRAGDRFASLPERGDEARPVRVRLFHDEP